MDELHSHLLNMYPALDAVVDHVLAALDVIIAPHYKGPLGVDMMIYRDGNKGLAVNPCVEVNLRMTMGMVVAALGQNHGLRGQFSIGNKVTEGTPLTPPASQYQAYLS